MATGDSTKLIIELEVLLRNLNRTLRGLDQVKRKLESVASVRVTQRSTAAATERQAIAAQRLALQQQRLQLQQQRLSVQTQELANRQERARQASERLTRANDRLTHSLSSGQRIAREFQSRLNTISAAALRVGGGLRSLGLTVSVGLTAPLAAFARIAARSAVDIDAIRNRLTATEGSAEAANRRLVELRQLADDSVGVTRRTALDTFAILTTLGEVTESTINQQIKAFGRLNAAFTVDDQQVFFRNLVQIFQQQFEQRDIREALGRVPIFNQLLEQAFGTSDPDRLRALKASGKLTLDTFLAGLAQAIETDPVLGQIGESIGTRFAKTFERLSDALEPLGRAILGPLERIIVTVEPIILRLSATFESLSPSVQTAIVVIGLLAAALGPLLFIVGGLASGLGALGTALATLVPLLGTIGLPAILALLAGVGVLITQLTVGVVLLAQAWRTNFLDIQGTVGRAANGILGWFTRIRAIINEATQRILPTLQSITEKVVNAIQQVWDRYGKFVVETVGRAFRFILDLTENFLRLFADFVDLVLKLIDGDWRGAWRAFARIVVTAIDQLAPLFGRLTVTLTRALLGLVSIVNILAVRFVIAAQRLATSFVATLAAELVKAYPQVRDALTLMLLNAALSLNPTSIAAVLVAKLLAALRKAASEGIPAAVEATVGVDAGSVNFPRRRRKGTATTTEDEKGASRIAKEADRLREAQDRLAETREKNQIELLRSRIEGQFDATKAGLDRELSALEENFGDRLVALRKYLKERKDLEEAQIDAEIVKELELTSVLFRELSARARAAEREFQTELKEIDQNAKLKGQARQLAIQTAETKKARDLEEALGEFKLKHEESTRRVVELEKQRKATLEELTRLERRLTEEVERQRASLQFDLFEEQGRTADAAAGRLKQRFTDTLKDLRIDTSAIGAELQDALNRVDLTTLQQRLDELPEPVRVLIELLDIGVKRAQIIEAQQLVEDLSAGLRLDEERIQNRVLDGLINQREAQAQIVELQQKYRAVLLDILAGELARAEAIRDQGLITSIQAQIAETERLGVAIDEVGRDINRALFSDIQSGISGIFSGARRGFEGLRDAAISFGERLLDTLNDIAATSIMKQLEGLFKPDAADTKGTVGGFFSKLFGLGPKAQSDAAAASATLQAGATSAAATITTGSTAASTGFATTVLTSATSFASLIISAGAAFAAAVTASGAASAAIGGAGGALGGLAAATGLFPAVPGGVVRVVEGGYPEAVLTTDPRHAVRQVAILRAFLRETRGLGGRIRGLAAGGFAMPDLALNVPSVSLPSTSFSGMEISSQQATNIRILNMLDKRQLVGGHLRSAEGAQDILNVISENAPEIGRRIGIK